jgi:hypothetical protein
VEIDGVNSSPSPSQVATQPVENRFGALAAQLRPFPVETCGANEPLYDYTLRPYAAAVEPLGRLRSTVLLYQLLADSRQKPAWQRLIAGLREQLGLHRTIWGVKRIAGRLGAELYFYFRTLSAARAHREAPETIPDPITFAQVADALAPTLRIQPTYPAHAPAIMLSVDVNDEVLARGTINELHIYMQSGLSWDVSVDRIEHANHYTFFEMAEMDRLRALIEHQANGLLHASACGVDVGQLILPQLYKCRTMCLAAKRTADGVYYAGIDTSQLGWFMERFDWPETTRTFLRTYADDLAHIRWDVGLDYVATGPSSGDSVLRWVKSGVYGTF